MSVARKGNGRSFSLESVQRLSSSHFFSHRHFFFRFFFGQGSAQSVYPFFGALFVGKVKNTKYEKR